MFVVDAVAQILNPPKISPTYMQTRGIGMTVKIDPSKIICNRSYEGTRNFPAPKISYYSGIAGKRSRDETSNGVCTLSSLAEVRSARRHLEDT